MINLSHSSPDTFTTDAMQEFVVELVAAVIGNFELRFPEADILSAFAIFDPASYTTIKLSHLSAFGASEFKQLLRHFCGGHLPVNKRLILAADLKQLGREFSEMKTLLWNAGQDRHCDIYRTWS